MTASTFEFDFQKAIPDARSADMPLVEETHWGYAIGEGPQGRGVHALMQNGARFFGSILLLAAAGLWIMPDSYYGAEIFSMKLAAMVMFSIFGGYLFWAGSPNGDLEYQIDTKRHEVRVGRRSLRGEFRLAAVVPFTGIASVFLMRSKESQQSARLFLRLAGEDAALELASGPELVLERLRTRLAADFAGHSRAPLETQLTRHHHAAA